MKLRGVDGQTYDLKVELHEGTNGTTLGRCDRFNLGWPSGPWDNEPDVMHWRFKQTDLVMFRNDVGQWCAFVSAGRDRGPPEIAKLTGINPKHLMYAFRDFDDLRIGHLYGQGMGIVFSQGHEDAMPTVAAGIGYRSAAVVVQYTAQILKALHLDERLRDGNALARLFDSAAGVFFDGTPRRIDVEEIVAEGGIGRTNAVAMKTWAGDYLLHVHARTGPQNDLSRGSDLIKLVDRAEPWAMGGEESFKFKCREWLRANVAVASGPVDLASLDRLMQSELEQLDKLV